MNLKLAVPLRRVGRQQWFALLLSLGLGAAMCALLFAGLRPAAVLAAGPADPAAVYNCNVGGLDLALATGGSATFNCVAPTTLIITPSRTVIHNVTLDGGNKLILSGNHASQVFSVTTGIHLTLLNLTIRDAAAGTGAGVFNNGTLNVTAVQFISNTAAGGAAIYNASGAVANISGTTVISSESKGGAVWNGDQSVPASATMSIANSNFIHNFAGEGAAIFNSNGPLTVTGSSFTGNVASLGGAIGNFSLLKIDNSQFTSNFAGTIVIDSLAQLKSHLNLPASPAGLFIQGGGALYIGSDANTSIKGSSFTDNVGQGAGGAIFFGVLPSGALITPTGASLSIDSSTLSDNCGGTGGAIATSQRTSLSTSTLNENFADSGSSPCILWAASRPNGPRPGTASPQAPVVVPPAGVNGAGGAIFSVINLSVDNTTFMTNTATVTTTGGGGAIANFTLGVASVFNDRFADNQAEQDGGAIYNSDGGAFTVNSSQFRTNHVLNDSGSAIASQGALSVTQSSFTANYGAPGHGNLGGGGAIFNGLPSIVAQANGPAGGSGRLPQVPQGTLGPPTFLYLDHSTFVSNSSDYEGGAVDAGPALLTANSFTSNTAAYGGAIDVWHGPFTLTASSFVANAAVTTTTNNARQGGAIDANSWAVTVVNSTFYRNHAVGAAVGGALNSDLGGTVAITNSTFLSNTADTLGNGGAFSHGGIIVANSSGGSRPAIPPPAIISLHNVLLAFSGGGDCDSAATLNGANLEFPDNSCGSASVTADPKALPPADNGGPTLTSALLPSSPAINAGDDAACPNTDQRGAPRPVGIHCDIGAFEFGGLVPRLWFPAIR